MDTIREWCKQVRDLGVIVGVGTHKPEVIDLWNHKGGTWTSTPAAFTTAPHSRRNQAGPQRRNHRNAPGTLSPERSAQDVQGHAPDPQALLRVQDPRRGPHRQ